MGTVVNDRRTSPSGSVSSTNDSGYSVSPASPCSLQVKSMMMMMMISLLNKSMFLTFR